MHYSIRVHIVIGSIIDTVSTACRLHVTSHRITVGYSILATRCLRCCCCEPEAHFQALQAGEAAPLLLSLSCGNCAYSYTARRLEANVYQFEELALKAISIGSPDLAVELLINSIAVDEQQEETWYTALLFVVSKWFQKLPAAPYVTPPLPPSLPPSLRYRLGNAFHELKLDFHAAACYRRCLALNRNDLRFWNDLGSA